MTDVDGQNGQPASQEAAAAMPEFTIGVASRKPVREPGWLVREQLGDGAFAETFGKLCEDLLGRCDVTQERASVQMFHARMTQLYQATEADERASPASIIAMGAIMADAAKRSADLALVQSRIDASTADRGYKMELVEFMHNRVLKAIDEVVRKEADLPKLADRLTTLVGAMSDVEERAKYGEADMKFL